MEKLAGVSVDSRYQVPSAHITIARFINDLEPDVVNRLLEKISEINLRLESSIVEWVLGSERAGVFRSGRIWYGGGWSEGHGLTIEEVQS